MRADINADDGVSTDEKNNPPVVLGPYRVNSFTKFGAQPVFVMN
jgi:hypothetical protein